MVNLVSMVLTGNYSELFLLKYTMSDLELKTSDRNCKKKKKKERKSVREDIYICMLKDKWRKKGPIT